VLDIVAWHEHQRLTLDEIVSNVPSITLGDLHAARPWYFDYVQEIQARCGRSAPLYTMRAGIMQLALYKCISNKDFPALPSGMASFFASGSTPNHSTYVR